MTSTNDFSSIDMVIEVNGKDVNMCVEYWVDYWDYCIIETVNGLPSDMLTDSTIDTIIKEIVDTAILQM